MDKTVKVLVVLFAVVGIGLFGYHSINRWHHNAVERQVNSEKEASLAKIAELEAEIRKMGEELESQRTAMPTQSELSNVFGAERPAEGVKSDHIDCRKVTAQVMAFFDYLDSKAYLIWPGINSRAEVMFDDIVARLAANPPINVGEMEHLYSLVRNVTHFYRVLGKERIELLKEIMNSESAVLEPAIAVMYTWLTTCRPKSDTNLNDAPSLKTMYQYASYFLNTMGGRSYLLRRDSKIRMLVNFYALSIVDMANDAGINSYGIDIRTYIDYLFYDLNNQKGLLYPQRYLTKLAAMQAKYR
jgi:hypothetical protein